MDEAVNIAINGIIRFTEHNPVIKTFTDKLVSQIDERSDVAMRLANIFCAHKSMKQFLPMFLTANDAEHLKVRYNFLEQMEMSINGAGKLTLIRVNCTSGCWQAFLVKDEQSYDELLSYIKNEMFAISKEVVESIDFKDMTWTDMVKLVDTAIDYVDVDSLFKGEPEHVGFYDNVSMNVFKKGE